MEHVSVISRYGTNRNFSSLSDKSNGKTNSNIHENLKTFFNFHKYRAVYYLLGFEVILLKFIDIPFPSNTSEKRHSRPLLRN